MVEGEIRICYNLRRSMQKTAKQIEKEENMDKQELKKLIDTAAGRIPADLVIKNCKVVNVFSGEIISGDIAVSGSKIAGIGEYEGREVVDAEGSYAFRV